LEAKMIVRVLVLALLVVPWSCARAKNTNTVNVGPEAQSKTSGLSQLPPLSREGASLIAQAANTIEKWKNPFIMVRPDGVELVSRDASTGAQIMSIPQMREALLQLPATAWPLGRIVAVQEIGIRSSSNQDDEAIERKREELNQMLESLEIAANWWPSA
jgi:hypothetical protein